MPWLVIVCEISQEVCTFLGSEHVRIGWCFADVKLPRQVDKKRMILCAKQGMED